MVIAHIIDIVIQEVFIADRITSSVKQKVSAQIYLLDKYVYL